MILLCVFLIISFLCMIYTLCMWGESIDPSGPESQRWGVGGLLVVAAIVHCFADKMVLSLVDRVQYGGVTEPSLSYRLYTISSAHQLAYV